MDGETTGAFDGVNIVKSKVDQQVEKYHPDIVGGTGEKFKRILLAYEQIAGYVHSEGEEEGAFDFAVNVKIDRKTQTQDLFDDLKDGILTLFDIGKRAGWSAAHIHRSGSWVTMYHGTPLEELIIGEDHSTLRAGGNVLLILK